MENEEKIVDGLEITNDEDTSNNEDISNDDSWIDDLEPYKSEPAVTQSEEQNTELPKDTNLDDTALRAKYDMIFKPLVYGKQGEAMRSRRLSHRPQRVCMKRQVHF